MFSRILAGTDFSPGADAAWRFAIDLARAHGAATILLHVALEGALRNAVQGAPADDEYLGQVSSDLLVLAARAEEAGVAVQTALRVGDPAARIAEVAREHDADIIVVGTHAQRFATLLVGSVAERLLRIAPCSVVVVKGYAAGVGERAA
jgi:nucleotide-binding universal stress UspA family protein